MKQTKEDLERGYEKPDPWGYQSSIPDMHRRRMIIGICQLFAPVGNFNAALDVGCGEAWITRALPARSLFGYELSDKARGRFPVSVKKFEPGAQRTLGRGAQFDLVTCMGALYAEYDHAHMIDVIRENASDVIVVSGIKEWELPIDLVKAFDARQVFEAEFPYPRPEASYTQQVRVFKK